MRRKAYLRHLLLLAFLACPSPISAETYNFELSDKNWTVVNLPKQHFGFRINTTTTIFLRTGNYLYKLVPDPDDAEKGKVYISELSHTWQSPYNRTAGPYKEVIPPQFDLQGSNSFELRSEAGLAKISVVFKPPPTRPASRSSEESTTVLLWILFVVLGIIGYYVIKNLKNRLKSNRTDFDLELPLKDKRTVRFRFALIWVPNTKDEEFLRSFQQHLESHIKSSLIFLASYEPSLAIITPQDLTSHIESTLERFKKENREYRRIRIKPYITSIQVASEFPTKVYTS